MTTQLPTLTTESGKQTDVFVRFSTATGSKAATAGRI